MAWALYNRGRLLFDAGRLGDGIEDFLAAARAGIELDGFHDSVGRRVIRERGFQSLLDLLSDSSLPEAQRIGFLGALGRAIRDAGSYGGWFVESPIEMATDGLTYLMVLVALADILRDSPVPWVGTLHLSRSRQAYSSVVLTEAEIAEHLWFRPRKWGMDGPDPDRIEHLTQLEGIIAFLDDEAPEAAWAAHYVSAAIALSTLLGGRPDWPTTVLRFSVALEVGDNGLRVPLAAAVASVARWVAEREEPGTPTRTDPERLALFAAEHLRAAAAGLRTLVMAGREPAPATAWLIGEDDLPLTKDGEWVTGSPAALRANDIWSWVEPVFREWVTTAVVSSDTNEHLAASSCARQFNALTATELWGNLALDQWAECRRSIVSFHDAQPTVDSVAGALADRAPLVDFYVQEVVEDTVVRLAVAPNGVDVRELLVDTMAGDLAALLQAHRQVRCRRRASLAASTSCSWAVWTPSWPLPSSWWPCPSATSAMSPSMPWRPSRTRWGGGR